MKALVLAGGFPQIALIKELQSRNIYVLLADYFENPIARSYADEFYQISTLDVEAITKLAEREGVDFLITACTDQALLTVAKVSETLGLPCYIDYETALNVTNKSYMKKVFRDNGIPTAPFLLVNDLNEIEKYKLTYPSIVKPVDCNSSKGVKKVYNYLELAEAFEAARNMSRSKMAIIEEFIDGNEITVDVQVENGKAHVLSMSYIDKAKEDDKFLIFRTRWPIFESEVVKKEIAEVAQKIADSFGLYNSPMLIQLISDGEKIYVIEFSARTGGGEKHIHIKKVCGFDVISAVVDLTLKKQPELIIKKPEAEYFTTLFIYCNPGEYSHMEGLEELKEREIIMDYYLFKNKGANISSATSSGDRAAGFTICANTMEELREKYETAINNVKVIDINGKDITRHDLSNLPF